MRKTFAVITLAAAITGAGAGTASAFWTGSAGTTPTTPTIQDEKPAKELTPGDKANMDEFDRQRAEYDRQRAEAEAAKNAEADEPKAEESTGSILDDIEIDGKRATDLIPTDESNLDEFDRQRAEYERQAEQSRWQDATPNTPEVPVEIAPATELTPGDQANLDLFEQQRQAYQNQA